MLSLGDVDISTMFWANRTSYANVQQSGQQTITGRLVLQQQPLRYRPIILTATNSRGFLQKPEVEKLRKMSRTTNTYIFSFFGENYVVLFDHRQGPAANFTPFKPSQDIEEEGYYFGNINLITEQ